MVKISKRKEKEIKDNSGLRQKPDSKKKSNINESQMDYNKKLKKFD